MIFQIKIEQNYILHDLNDNAKKTLKCCQGCSDLVFFIYLVECLFKFS